MKNKSKNDVYDLAVIGNGIAAQTFLWNLSHNANKSQNFSIAHLYSSEIAPECTMRSSATVSLNGIEEDVSPLGNDMRESYFLFDDLYKNLRPEGVEEVPRVVVSTSENETKKLLRRYKTLETITSDKIKNTYPGKVYNSYMITPKVFSKWLEKNISLPKTDFPFFVKDLEKNADEFHLKLHNDEIVRAKKVLFATGAFSKIFEKFHSTHEDSIESKNVIKAGSYLERDIDLGPGSFYLTIDGNYVLYRRNNFESKMIIGSATIEGAYEASDLPVLSAMFEKIKPLLTFDIGNFSDFKIVTGLRHKGPKRLMICEAINQEKTLFRINGLYKNGYSMSFLAAKRMEQLITS